GGPCAGPTPRDASRKEADHATQGSGHPVRQRPDSGDDDERDEPEHQGVLGHRLAVLFLPGDREPSVHVRRLPFRSCVTGHALFRTLVTALSALPIPPDSAVSAVTTMIV